MLDIEQVRVNPAYRLLALDELTADQRSSLQALGIDSEGGVADVAGVLVATAWSGLPDKAVDGAAARLVERITTHGAAGIGQEQMLVLLYDGIVVADLDHGTVTGPAAFEPVEGDAWAVQPAGRLAAISHAAVEAVARLDLGDVEAVCSRLYWHGRLPLSPRWARALPDAAAVVAMIRDALEPSWAQAMPVEEAGGWLLFARRDGRRDAPSRDFPYKLYVSAMPSELTGALPRAIEAATGAGASRFKVGADANGLLRSDKMVVYVGDADELAGVAKAIATGLRGVAAHGVPFTAAMTDDGLLSWGGDPTAADAPLGGDRESWRLSVCRRLAEQLVAARHARLTPAVMARFALRRLSLDGVDVSTFAPSELLAPRRIAAAPLAEEHAA